MAEHETASPIGELLEVDHRHLDTLLADAKRCLQEGDFESAREKFGAFRAGLDRHIDAEEKELFPAFEAVSGATGGGPTDVMRMEHAELKELMAEIDGVLGGVVGERLTTPIAKLTARIYAHNGKEERILYPMADRLLREAGVLDDLIDRLHGYGI